MGSAPEMREHQRAQAGNDGDRTREVELAETARSDRLARAGSHRGDQRHDADRDVDPEDACHPAQVVSSPPTRTPAAMPRPPTAPHERQTLGALRARVGRHDERQRGRASSRAAPSPLAATGARSARRRWTRSR